MKAYLCGAGVMSVVKLLTNKLSFTSITCVSDYGAIRWGIK